MKKILLILGVCLAGLTSPAFAASGLGCNVWGPVSTVVISNSGSTSQLLAIINGYACIVSGATSSLTPMVGILATAQANGKQGYLTDNVASLQ
ncbi:MAG TPA: hypothetical protein VGA00_01550 [Acidiferrobacterales bacterium]|jgi:hypothetical protein